MNELIFLKYFMVRICDDRLYFERIKTKPVTKILSDILANKAIMVLFAVTLFFALIMYVPGVNINQFIVFGVPSALVCLTNVFTIYHDQHHKNTVIGIKHIKKVYFDKRRNILKMEYVQCNRVSGIRIVDLPDNDMKIKNIIDKLNDAGLICEPLN